jgi:N-acetylglucosaminyl-diphospho-decaprenol L-rhamnosyltransferase
MSLLLSIVSHEHSEFVAVLLNDLKRFCSSQDMAVIVTLNVRERIPFKTTDFDFGLEIIENKRPRGFAANHNTAFKLKKCDFFCVLNPDLRLTCDPFPRLFSMITKIPAGVIAPLIVNLKGEIEDSARRLPTPLGLIRRHWMMRKEGSLEYLIGEEILYPDWLAGMFMMFPCAVFAKMNGFDEKYHLYFEDVDLCTRLRVSGYRIALDPSVSVIHEARRDSHQRFQFLLWHILSGLRFFSSGVFWASLLNRFQDTGKKNL